MAEHRHLLEPRRAGREVTVDRALEHPPREALELELLADELIEHLAGAQVLQVEPGRELDETATRGRRPEQLMHVLARIDLQHQRPPARRECRPDRGGDGRLADAPLAGHHDELSIEQASTHGAQLYRTGSSATRSGYCGLDGDLRILRP